MFKKNFLENLELLLPVILVKPEKSMGREGNNLLGFWCAFWTMIEKFSHENEKFHDFHPSFVMLYMWKYSVSLEVARVLSHKLKTLFKYITGKWLGSRQIRCNWAAKGANSNDDKQNLDSKSLELTNGTSGALILKMKLLFTFVCKAILSCTGVCVCVCVLGPVSCTDA